LNKDQLLFTQFLSTGANVETFIASKNPNLPLDKFDLEEINIQPLPSEHRLEQ
jgi:hypothetical protein